MAEFDFDNIDMESGLSLRQEIRLLRRTTARMSSDMKKIQGEVDSMSTQLAELQQATQNVSQAAGTGMTMLYMTRLTMYGGTLGMAGAAGMAGLIGVNVGLDAAKLTLEENEKVRTGRVVWGGEIAKQAYLTDVWLRTFLKIISIGVL